MLRNNMASNQIGSLIGDSDPEIQEVGLRNVTELSTADEGLAYLRAQNLVPHLTKLLDSPVDKIQLLANWCAANMTSKDDEFRLAFNDVGALTKVASLVSTASGQILEKVLALITNMAQNDAVRVSICSNGVVASLLARIASSAEPNLVCALVSPLISLLKSPNATVHDHIVEKGGVTVVMKLLNKLTGNVSGTLRSADYELLRSLLVTLFFLVASPSTIAKGSLLANGFLKISTTLSQLILPPDVGTQAVLLQVLVCLSVVSTVDTSPELLLWLDSGVLLRVIDYLGSLSDELVLRSIMLLANLCDSPKVRHTIKMFGWDSFVLPLLRHHSHEISRHTLRFVVNVSANPVCRKLLIDAGVMSHLESYSSSPIGASNILAQHALANIKVPILEAELNESLKIETVEIEVDNDEKSEKEGSNRASTPSAPVSFTSVEIQDPFQQLDMELKSFFGPDALGANDKQEAPPTNPAEIVPLVAVRGRTATMTKDPKDEPMYLRREKIAKEVFETEEKYVSNLKVLLDVFVNPLNQAIIDHKPILTVDEMNTVFSVVQLIYNLHVSFLNKLRPIFAKWTWSSCIGSHFETLADRLKVYETFVNNYDRALALLDSPALQKRKAFQGFMKDAALKASGVAYAGISHYLIMPIQRPPRFLMLLGELVKYTPSTHIDYASLKRSVQKMSALASYLNEARRISETETKVEEITSRFGGPLIFDGETFDIALPGRVFLREGSLVEDRSHLPKSSARDTIMMGKRDSWIGTVGNSVMGDKSSSADSTSGSGSYTPRDSVSYDSPPGSSSNSVAPAPGSGQLPSASSPSPSPSLHSSSGNLHSTPSAANLLSSIIAGGSGNESSPSLHSREASGSGSAPKFKRTPRYVFLFLFNDTLLIASMQKKMLQSRATMHAKLTLINVLPLSLVATIDSNPDPTGTSKQSPLKVALRFKDPETFPLVFVADNELEKGEWVSSLNTALKASQVKQDQDSQLSELDKLIGLL